jgi:chemotaxis signal transduction protein
LLLRCTVDSSKFEAHDEHALEVQVGKARVVVALDQVDRIIETLCTPMPKAHRLVRGIGFDERRPIVCVMLSGKPAELAPRTITAVLLVGHGPVVWALCADQVFGVVTLVGRSTAYDARWPRWLGRVRSQDGRTLAQLDGAQMALDIGGVR